MTNDAHARTSADAEAPLYDHSIPTPTHAERARTMVDRITTGTLCTIAEEPEGYPYGSFVTFAFEGADPIFLISGLAEHTKNLKREPRASLLVAESGAADPLANGRVTLLGRCECLAKDQSASARSAYLKVHPNAEYYVDFKDFAFFQLRTEAVRYIGGYGRMSWVKAEDWRSAQVDPIGAVASRILQHMNEDHEQDMVLLCHSYSRASDVSAVTMTGIDRYGFELAATTQKGNRPVRIAFPETISDAKQARTALVELVKAARR